MSSPTHANISEITSLINGLLDRFEEQEEKIKDFKDKEVDLKVRNSCLVFRESKTIKDKVKEVGSICNSYFKEGNISEEECYSSLSKLKDEIEEDELKFEFMSNKEMDDYKKMKNKGGSRMGEKYGLRLIDSNGKVINALYKGQKFSNSSTKNNNLDLGKYIKGAITGDWKNAQDELGSFKELSTSTGKILIPNDLSSNILDKARNRIVLDDVPIIIMESNNLTIAKIDNDPVFEFKEELAESAISDMAFGQIDFKAKTVYGLMKISLELLHSAQNITQVIEDAISMSIARTIDEKGLYGDGTIEPKGILTLDNINKIEVMPVEDSKYQGFIKGLGAIRKANGEPTSIAYNATVDEEVNLLVDNIGLPLDKPKAISELDYIISNQIKDNQAIVYDKHSIVIGIQENVFIEVDGQGLGFKDGSVYIRVYAMLDVQAMYPENISLINFSTAKKSKTK